MDLYLDIKTRLPFKMVTNVSDGSGRLSARGAVTIRLSDYTSVDGIQMPRSITRGVRPDPRSFLVTSRMRGIVSMSTTKNLFLYTYRTLNEECSRFVLFRATPWDLSLRRSVAAAFSHSSSRSDCLLIEELACKPLPLHRSV